MKLQVINEERQPESVAPKIKVFDSEADLDAALPDLKDGAIVATKEDVSAEITENRQRSYCVYNVSANQHYYFVADKPQGYAKITYLRADGSKIITVMWDVKNATVRWVGRDGDDSITAGLNDNAYPGMASCHMYMTGNGSYFIETVDCILEHIEMR